VEITENQITLRELPIGARLVVKCKHDWRSAVVSRFDDEQRVTLIVCSPSGRTYRLRRASETPLVYDGKIPVLPEGCEDDWRDEMVQYDARW
jgi:hypothetical protein